MYIGDIVRLKGTDTYGKVKYSTFGFSIHFWNEEFNGLGKTLGDDQNNLEKYWEVVDNLPEGYEINKYGVPVKVK